MAKKKTLPEPVVFAPPPPSFGSPSHDTWEGRAGLEDFGAQDSTAPGMDEVKATMLRFANQGVSHGLDDYHPRADKDGKGW